MFLVFVSLNIILSSTLLVIHTKMYHFSPLWNNNVYVKRNLVNVINVAPSAANITRFQQLAKALNRIPTKEEWRGFNMV